MELSASVLVVVGVELPEDCRGRWEAFVDQTLSEANRKNAIDLVITLFVLYKNCFCSLKVSRCDHFGFRSFFLSRLGLGTRGLPPTMTWRVRSLKN